MSYTGRLRDSIGVIISANLTLAVMLLGVAVAFFLAHFLPPTRVGDGSEYYAMYFAWKDTLRPFMTDTSWKQVDVLSTSGEITGFVTLQWLKDFSPALRLGTTADFNHFWLYSALTALVSGFLSMIYIEVSAHNAFIVTHWLLFSLTTTLAYKNFRWKGVVAVFALTILSPMIWYIDKVHIEFFTFCLTLSAVIVFLTKNYILSALFLAIASTQNISFAAIAIIPFSIYFFDQKHLAYSRTNLIYVVFTCFFVLIHPFYYFSRYGVITPQLLAGGADIGGNLRLFYIWIIDPDVGLLGNWPFGVAIIFLTMFTYSKKKTCKENYYLILFFLTYLIISLFSQSSTQNLNSGATPGIARYALWYIPLFFPLVLSILNFTKNQPWLKLMIIFVCVVSLAYTYKYQRPSLNENYTQPSPLSLLIQKNASSLYNPPAEIFTERYSGVGESPSLSQARAIIGPDCRKVLVFTGINRDKIYGGQSCSFAEDKVKEVILRKLGEISPDRGGSYMKLNEQEIRQLDLTKPN